MSIDIDTRANTTQSSAAIGRLGSVLDTSIGVTVGNLAARALPALGRAVGDAIERMEQIAPVTAGFDALSASIGSTSDVMLSDLRVATRGLVGDFVLMKQANTAIILGVAKSSEEYARLSGAAIKLGRAVGLDAVSSIDSLTTGIGRQSRMMLDNLGVIVKAEDANKRYADKIGVASSALTEQQKKLAFTEEAIRQVTEAADSLGDANLNLADRINQAKNAVSNMKDEFLLAFGASDRLNSLLDDLGSTISSTGDQMTLASVAGEFFAGLLSGIADQFGGNVVRAMAEGRRRLAEWKGEVVETSGEVDEFQQSLNRWVDELGSLNLQLVAVEGLDDAFESLGAASTDYLVTAPLFVPVSEAAAAAFDAWKASMDGVVVSLADVKAAQEEVERLALAAAGQNIPQMTGAVDEWTIAMIDADAIAAQLPADLQAIDAAAQQTTGILGQLGAAFTSAFSGDQLLATATNAIGGLLTGGIDGALGAVQAGLTQMLSTALNSLIPGLGVIAGPLVNAITNLFSNIFSSASVGEDLGRDLGVSISAGLMASIEQTADQLGDIFSAITLRLADIIREVGINTEADLAKFARRTRDLFSLVESGHLSLAQVQSVINDQFALLVAGAEKFGQTGNEQLSELIELAERFGIVIDADLIAQFEALGVTITDTAEEAVSVWRAAMAALGITVADSTAEITKDQIKAIKALGLSAELERKLIRGLLAEQQQAELEAIQSFKRSIRERAIALGATNEEARAVVRETLRQQRAEERKADREAIRDAKLKARGIRDAFSAELAGFRVRIPVDVDVNTRSVRRLAGLIVDQVMRDLEDGRMIG